MRIRPKPRANVTCFIFAGVIGNALEHVAEVVFRIEAVEPCRYDQRTGSRALAGGIEPLNGQFFRPRHIGCMDRSAALLLRQARPLRCTRRQSLQA